MLIGQTVAALRGSPQDRIAHLQAQRGQWQDELAQLHRRAAAEGARGLADLVEAIQALLADEGRAAGVGAGLEEPFAAVWRRIVEEL